MQDRSPAALCRGNAVAKLVRGTFLRIADMRFRSAYISVAVSRSTDRRRIVETSELDRRHPSEADWGRWADATPASRPFVLASLRALRLDPEAPPAAHSSSTTDQPVVGHAPKTIPTHWMRPLDKPLHISSALAVPGEHDIAQILKIDGVDDVGHSGLDRDVARQQVPPVPGAGHRDRINVVSSLA